MGVGPDDRGIDVLEIDLHQRRERAQPGDPVVHLEERAAARLQDAPAFVDEPRVIGVYWMTPCAKT